MRSDFSASTDLAAVLPQAEREARIAEENSSMGPSSRVVEEAALIEKLSVRVPVSLHGRSACC